MTTTHWHDTEYLDRKQLTRAIDGLTDRNNFNSFLSFRRYSQPYVHQQQTVPRCHRHHPQWQKTRGHTFSRDLDWLSCGERWRSLHLLTWHIRSCMLCPAGANGMRSDQWQNKQSSHFFQDLDWLSCGERWQSLHLLIWHVRSCMLCSASSKDMRSDQWQTISVCPHLLPRFRLIAFR